MDVVFAWGFYETGAFLIVATLVYMRSSDVSSVGSSTRTHSKWARP